MPTLTVNAYSRKRNLNIASRQLSNSSFKYIINAPIKRVDIRHLFSKRAFQMQVIWNLSVKPIGNDHCAYTDSVDALTTRGFLTFIDKHGITLKQAAAARQAASGDHHRRETPLFAKSIKRRALARPAS